jgi:uncharacterized protein (TIGR02246 family)
MARAETPGALYAIIEDGFNRGDLDPVVAAYEDDAALVVPRDGDIARGRDAIRAATAAVFALQPEMTLEFVRKVEADKMAMTHGRWRLAVTSPDGERSEMSGRGTLISRRRPDGSWGHRPRRSAQPNRLI